MKSRIKILSITILISILLLSTTFIFPYGFSAIHNQTSAVFWLFISQSGGTFGVPLITFAFCIIISAQFRGWYKKMLSITLSLLAFSIILGGFARFNEYIIKEKLKVQRPNIKYLDSQHILDADKFYMQDSKDARRTYLKDHLQIHDVATVYFDNEPLHPEVVNHWIQETGYSFPSGHSVNAFLMATLIGYILLFIYSDFRRKMLFIMPFMWATLVALSRVILGVHSPTDITLGALMGSIVAYLIIITGVMDRYLKQKSS